MKVTVDVMQNLFLTGCMVKPNEYNPLIPADSQQGTFKVKHV